MKLKTLLFLALSLLVASSAFGANSLAVTAAAAMGGTGGTACGGAPCGLAVTVDGSTNPARVVDDTPNDEAVYRAQFYLDMNDVVQGEQTFWVLARGTEQSSFTSAFQLIMTRKFNQWRLFLRARTNGSVDRFTGRITWDDADLRADTLLQIEFYASDAPGVPGGDVELSVLQGVNSGTSVNTFDIFGNLLNNSTKNVDDILLGAVGNIPAGQLNGTFHIDEFASFRTLAPQ